VKNVSSSEVAGRLERLEVELEGLGVRVIRVGSCPTRHSRLDELGASAALESLSKALGGLMNVELLSRIGAPAAVEVKAPGRHRPELLSQLGSAPPPLGQVGERAKVAFAQADVP
jgi:hypothetical protein